MATNFGSNIPVMIMYDSSDNEIIRYSFPKNGLGMWYSIAGAGTFPTSGWTQHGTDTVSHTGIDLNPLQEVARSGDTTTLMTSITGIDRQKGFIGFKISGKIECFIGCSDIDVQTTIKQIFDVRNRIHYEQGTLIDYMKLQPHVDVATSYKILITNDYDEVPLGGGYDKYKVQLDFIQEDIS